ncbi:MAG TPA: hypothetical protein VFQ61_17155 [Polyangiaceae bacterium]|nr:hypothetical protein [Polyangiaceae bacterium]
MKPTLRACLVALSASACGPTESVYLGSLPANGGRGGGTQAGAGMASGGSSGVGEWICNSEPCATHSGSRVDSSSGVPADAPERMAAAPPAPSGANELAWLYPNHESRIPANLGPVRFEWLADETDRLFQVRYSGPRTEVMVFTETTHYEPSPELWDWIAESNIGGAVTIQLSALTNSGERKEASAVQIEIGIPLEEGAVYLWSTAARGVLRAAVTSTHPERVEPSAESQQDIDTLAGAMPAPADDAGAACAGCHSLSRDGSRLALDLGNGRLRVADVRGLRAYSGAFSGTGGEGGTPIGKSEKVGPSNPAVWSTFSPDSTRLLAASGGKLQLFDLRDTAQPSQPVASVPVPEKRVPSHPDWSPVGDRIAFTLAEKGQGRAVERGAIAVVDYLAEMLDAPFGAVEIVVPSQGVQENNLFPSFSPDGQFLAYVTLSGNSENPQRASVRMVRLSDRKTFELERLNRRLGTSDSDLAFGNSMPTWVRSADRETTWLAFSSLRPYASVRPLDAKRDQIWLAAIDMGAAARAQPTELVDPSWAAFWAPFQLLEHGNHRALFAPPSLVPPSPPASCSCIELCADLVDNDCDGSVDEEPCHATCEARERCDDGTDDDCDCVVDDCSLELCSDGLDNDGDGFADAADLSCPSP